VNVDLASMEGKKEYGLIHIWCLKVEGLLVIKSIEEMIFILMAQVNASKMALVNKWWDRKKSFKRIPKWRFGVSKETDNN